ARRHSPWRHEPRGLSFHDAGQKAGGHAYRFHARDRDTARPRSPGPSRGRRRDAVAVRMYVLAGTNGVRHAVLATDLGVLWRLGPVGPGLWLLWRHSTRGQ